ncbi:MAG: type II secretion system GspH family protein [Aquincola sp.]|nr:type II secretion system GspH family protein [Aquincola sp.]
MQRSRGFTYLALLAVVAATGIGAAAVGTFWHTAQQREKERELLAVGAEIQHAIRSYLTSAGVGRPAFPRTLDDLVLDQRHPNVVRHLRRVYVDPMTGKADWGLVRAPDGGIMGVHSLSEGRPLKRAGFDALQPGFETAERYADWRFVHRVPAQQPAAQGRQRPAVPGR